jgi:hypothetical protein
MCFQRNPKGSTEYNQCGTRNGGVCLDRHSFRGYDGRDGALKDLGANLLPAPIDNGIFN